MKKGDDPARKVGVWLAAIGAVVGGLGGAWVASWFDVTTYGLAWWLFVVGFTIAGAIFGKASEAIGGGKFEGPPGDPIPLIYDDVKEEIGNCDLFLFKGDFRSSWLFTKVNLSFYSHAAFALRWGGRLMVLQAEGKGIETIPLSVCIGQYPGRVDWYQLKLEKLPLNAKLDEVAAHGKADLGVSYGYMALLKNLAHWAFKLKLMDPIEPKGMFCSQYVAHCFSKGHIAIGVSEKESESEGSEDAFINRFADKHWFQSPRILGLPASPLTPGVRASPSRRFMQTALAPMRIMGSLLEGKVRTNITTFPKHIAQSKYAHYKGTFRHNIKDVAKRIDDTVIIPDEDLGSGVAGAATGALAGAAPGAVAGGLGVWSASLLGAAVSAPVAWLVVLAFAAFGGSIGILRAPPVILPGLPQPPLRMQTRLRRTVFEAPSSQEALKSREASG